MSGTRLALIVANDEYDDPELGLLEAPAHDAEALAAILGEREVGDFDVDVLRNETVQAVRIAVESFFQRGVIDDLLLLYFSCHGLKNPDGELFLAMRDTRAGLLAATGLGAAFVNRQSADSRAGKIAMFLDCCFGGAFEKGMVVRAAGEAVVKDTFAGQETSDDARGRVVVTASTATQYAFEAGKLAKHHEKTSVFTSAVISGLTTGAADRDGDGSIGMNELFAYVEREVRRRRPEQRPQKFVYGATGEIMLARSRVRRLPLEPWIGELSSHPTASARRDAVAALRERIMGPDLGVALSAWDALEALRRDDNLAVAKAAKDAVAEATLQVTPPRLDVRIKRGGDARSALDLTGPPLALAVSAHVAAPWLKLEYDKPTVHLTASDPGVPEAIATIVLENQMGICKVPVHGHQQLPSPRLRLDRMRSRLPSAPPLTRWFLAAAALAVLAGALAIWQLWSGGEDRDTVVLPEGPPLGNDVIVWRDGSGLVSEGSSSEWNRLVNASDRAAFWPLIMPGRRSVLYQAKPAGSGVDTNTENSLRVVASDGTGDRLLFENDSDCPNPGRPAIAPDAQRLALVCFDGNGDRMRGVRILSLNGALERVLDGEAAAGGPTWTEDGKHIVYWFENEYDFDGSASGKGSSLRAIAVDPSEPSVPVRLTDDATKDSGPAVSPDGDSIAFMRATEPGDGDLFLLDVRSTDEGLLPEGPARRMQTSSGSAVERDPAWAPDSAWIIYLVDQQIRKVPPGITDTAVEFFDTDRERDASGMIAAARR